MLSGCGGYAYDSEIDKAVEICEPHGGVKKIYASMTFVPILYCKDGSIFNNYSEIKRVLK